MIKETLKAIRGAQSMMDMATQLGVGQEDLRQRLRILEDGGYIEKVGSSGGGCPPATCKGCHCCGPSSTPQSSTYVLTDKGKKALSLG